MNSWGLSWGLSWGGTWGLTRIEESARSGYWRLALYQLQEEWLNKRKAPILAIPDEPKIRIRYLKYQEPSLKTDGLLEPLEAPPQTKLAPYRPPSATLTEAAKSQPTIFEIVRWLEFTTALKHAKVAPLARKEAPSAANDETLLLLLLA